MSDFAFDLTLSDDGWHVQASNNEGYNTLLNRTGLHPQDALELGKAIDKVIRASGGESDITTQIRTANAATHGRLLLLEKQQIAAVERLAKTRDRIAAFEGAK